MLNLYRKWFSPTLGQTSELRRQRLAPVKRSNRRRPHLELLEDRVVPSTFGKFNIDGTLMGSVSPSPYDWNNLNGPSSFALPKIDTVQNDMFNSAMDDQFTSGQKENQATFTVSKGTSPSKADLTRMYVGHGAIPTSATASDVYVFLGFNRFNNSGDTFTDFELNQGTAIYNAGGGVYLPYRTNGDLLITFDFSNGTPAIGLLSWSGNATSGNWVTPGTSTVGVPENLLSSGLGVGAVNATTVNNPFSTSSNPYGASIPFADGSNPSTFAAGLFGEAAIDLTKALPASAKGTFNWVYMSTRSSSSYTSSLKDVIQPFSIDIPLQADVRGKVFADQNANGTQDAGENGLAGWTVQLVNSSNTIISSVTTPSDGSYDFPTVGLGTYTVREVAPIGSTYVQTSPTALTTGLPSNVTVPSTGTPDSLGYTASYSVSIQPGFADQGLNFGDRLKGDLSITKTDNTTSATAGSSTTYTIVVSNSGPSTASSVVVSDLLPASNATSMTWSGNGHTNVSGNLTDTIASLASGASVTYTVKVNISATATGNLVNTATVTVPSNFFDTNTGNNSATDTDSLGGQADLAVAKTDGKTTAVPGIFDIYTITVTNNGPTTISSLSMIDTLPATLLNPTFGTPSAGSYDSTTHVWSGLTLANTQSVSITVSGTIDPSATGSITNTVTVAPPAGVTDPISTNNTASDTDTLIPPDITVTKTGNGPISAGETAIWTIVVSNIGQGSALGVVLSDPLPNSGAGDITWSTDAGSISGGTLTDNIGTLAVGASVTIHVSGTTNNNDPPSITNTATASATNEPSSLLANNSATATITVNFSHPVISGLGDQTAPEGASTSFYLGGFKSVSTGTFNVDVNWGDGSADTTYTVTTATPNALTSLGSQSHIYAEEGNDLVTVTVTDPYNVSGSGTFNVTVSDQQLTSLVSNNLPITGTEATPIGAITGLSTFTDPAGPESTSDYTATINWGDSTTSTGTVVYMSGNNFRVDAPDHTYAEEGTYTVNVTLTHDALASVTTPDQTIVIADPFTFGKYPNISGLLDGDSVTLTRSFTDPAVTDAPWSVTINDGNGGTLTPAVSVNQNFTFTVSYPTANTYTVTVTVQDADGDAHVNHFTVSVDTPQLVLGGPVTSHPSTAMLTQQQLKPIVAAAINVWRAAGASPAQLNRLSHESIQIVSLTHPGLVGGTNPQGIQIDPTAAGHGWYTGAANSPAQGRVDLLSVVVHEMGNVLGLPEDNGNDVMGKWLATGERRLPVRGDLATALLFAGSSPWHFAASGSPVVGSSSGGLVLTPMPASMLDGLGSPTGVLPASAAAQAKALDDVFGLPLAQLLQDDSVLYAMLS